ncbi:undecaprenyldiphospho-muramoylpentapeptide beta-N-acetylglucosaminyltransferase [Methylococcus geothermalis]|uniref:UDP-N-acetylglucosamine--N-acetylmuramyl-(pentapeptide) pyrophosphoryl-undecaprenol N-acetylglucosamine transferase n=1 Tax=Methylococcus geothermalis TaxID=2681310 RepID=A0A858Q6K9_9GAMM|nr:undecaprenyldiphospho-muramoylpentapeptide beta-N-acetylglucosaminyltransferase [Methylococcus geothermalis]QJD29522.1 undecaprenyldiphospho-muramoylpentapeptide beta-N-acetylglucosaminyltransferase [Methylococcus geothermalis]
MAKRVTILAGGTGGHVFPALAVADKLRGAGAEVSWMGTRAGLEARVVPAAGYPIDWLSVSGIRGKGLAAKIKAPAMLGLACLQALRILRRRRPDVVLGMGGFVAGPGGLMARVLGMPLVIHEQNRIPGTTNRLLSRIANRVLEAFPGAFPESAGAVCTGNPLRQTIESFQESGPVRHGRRVLVLGGSLGAQALNRVVPRALAALGEEPVEIRHQTGQAMLEETKDLYQRLELPAKVDAFIEDMEEAYGWADVAVCRAGAMTVSELAAAGLPAILVPFPHAIDDHQTANGGYLAEAGAAVLMPQSALDEESLAEELRVLLDERGRLQAMSAAARNLARYDAAERVARICLEEAGA